MLECLDQGACCVVCSLCLCEAGNLPRALCGQVLDHQVTGFLAPRLWRLLGKTHEVARKGVPMKEELEQLDSQMLLRGDEISVGVESHLGSEVKRLHPPFQDESMWVPSWLSHSRGGRGAASVGKVTLRV